MARPVPTTSGQAVTVPAALRRNFTTADNGFVMVDSDLFGAEENYAASWVENCWFTIDDAVDFTGHPFVTVEFENRYRCWDNTTDIERCYLEISLDGVNWPDPETLEVEEGLCRRRRGHRGCPLRDLPDL